MFDVAIDHIDETSASLSGRARPQVANHVRSLPEQTLDALLRIEELMQQLLTERAIATKADIDLDVADLIQHAEPTKTPFMEAITAEQKPKRGRK